MKFKWLTFGLSILVMLMGISVIIQYKHSVSWNLDEIFVKDPFANGFAPGRMSPLMAYGFIISGIAFIGRIFQKRFLNEIPSIFYLDGGLSDPEGRAERTRLINRRRWLS